MSNTLTPKKLAEELGVSPKTIRAFARVEFPQHEYRAEWHFTPDMATKIRGHFRGAR